MKQMKQIKSIVTNSGLMFISLSVVLKFRGGPEVSVSAQATITQNRRGRWVYEEVEIQSVDDYKLNDHRLTAEHIEEYQHVMSAVGVDYDVKIERAVKRYCNRMGVERLASTAGIHITN
jgi:hypothetical protein